jgi:Putative Actinobacterial Holin-X, holin superfamily III
MVDQAQVTTKNGKNGTKNGQEELPPRAVARGMAEFLHDVATLSELQGKLFLIDVREGTAKLLVPVISLCVGAAIGLGCIPIALAALALMLKEITTLTLATCFGISLAIGLFMALVLTIVALGVVKAGLKMFDRSLYECGRNTKWAKDTLKRLSQSSTSSPLTPRW